MVDIDISPKTRNRHEIRICEGMLFASLRACSLFEGDVQFMFGIICKQHVAQIPSPRQDCAIGILFSRKTWNNFLPFGTVIILLSWGIEIVIISSNLFFLSSI